MNRSKLLLTLNNHFNQTHIIVTIIYRIVILH
jgi:hypothetical protein